MYKDLFAMSTSVTPFCLSKAFSALLRDEIEMLGQGVFVEEVHRAIHRMGGFKAPGPDELRALFF